MIQYLVLNDIKWNYDCNVMTRVEARARWRGNVARYGSAEANT
jgi:hypothetical protein